MIICDPEGEYFALVGALHGQVVRLATNSKDYLNPMDIQLSHKNDKEALKLKSDFIITLCDLIAGGKDGLENVILTEQDLTVKDQEEDGFGRYYNPDERGTRKKRIMLIRFAGRVRNMKNFRLARRLLSKRTSGSIKKTWRIHVCIFDGSDDLCDS